MLGAAFNAERVFSALWGSLNSSADTLLLPVIWAWIERLCTMASREVIQSYVTNAAQAITRAAPLTKMFTLVNLFVIEAPLPINIACSTSSHANCNFKQLRTQRQSRPLGIREVNLTNAERTGLTLSSQ